METEEEMTCVKMNEEEKELLKRSSIGIISFDLIMLIILLQFFSKSFFISSKILQVQIQDFIVGFRKLMFHFPIGSVFVKGHLELSSFWLRCFCENFNKKKWKRRKLIYFQLNRSIMIRFDSCNLLEIDE